MTQNMLEITMNQLLKRRGEAEHAIKDLGALYTETVVELMTEPSPNIFSFIGPRIVSKFHLWFPRSLLRISERESQTNTAGSVRSWMATSVL